MDWRKKAILLERQGEMNQIIQNCLFLLPVEKRGLSIKHKQHFIKEIEAWWDCVKKKWAEVRNLPKMLNLKTEMSEEHTGRKEELMRSYA